MRGFYCGFIAILMLFITALTHADNIPITANQYHRTLVRAAHSAMGLDAPIATLAAQIHQESRWNEQARSSVGATGIAQIMPATATWLVTIKPALGNAAPYNPAWAINAMIAYDNYLLARIQATDNCQAWAFTLAGYNGGQGWVDRDKKLAAANGVNKNIYFNNVERYNAGRKKSAFAENRHYVRIILTQHEPLYRAANWGNGVCAGYKV